MTEAHWCGKPISELSDDERAEMRSNFATVVALEAVPRGDKQTADQLRELADRVEAGDVLDVAVVADDKGEKVFWTIGTFADRWRLLGALEHAKAKTLMDCTCDD